jgi:Protein of unknown function (DUF3048) N-terminal domain/Protein of unknown function (DUF3048) C-terminal domain
VHTTSRGPIVLVAALLVVAAGCTAAEAPPPPRAKPSPTVTASPTPPRKARPAPRRPPRLTHNPLTGRRQVPAGPVVAVKIDNTAAGRPQAGLDSADVVYVEEVESGLTRLVAVYASRRPRRVEPVRSVRNSDPELLAQYGRVALAFSGGAGGPLATLRRSRLVDASPARYGGAYYRDGGRPAPYNLVLDLRRLVPALPGATARVRDVGFRWSSKPDPRLSGARARRVTRFSATVGTTAVSFRWDRSSRRWVQTAPGGQAYRAASGAPLGAPNVILQMCRVSVDRRNVDVTGSPAAYTHTIGSGPALLLRDGRGVLGRWVRRTRGSPTRFVDGAGKDLLLRPGGVWVLLARTGSRWVAG